MSGQHTPGVLGTDCHEHDEPYQNISLVIGTRTVATICIDDAPVHDFNAEQQANARRLVACWNACDGVPTDALEQIEGFGKAALPYHLLKAQRDEMLEALQKLAQHAGPHVTSGTLLAQAFTEACTTLAKATKG